MGGIVNERMFAGEQASPESRNASTATLADDEDICFGMVFPLTECHDRNIQWDSR
jgi:hypothetical protein